MQFLNFISYICIELNERTVLNKCLLFGTVYKPFIKKKIENFKFCPIAQF